MKIILEQLSLLNFKGIFAFTSTFGEGTNSIKGQNAAGKTTLFDAFLWVLFGKDSQGRTDFKIKPIDVSGTESQKLESVVEAIINVDGEKITFKKIMREVWRKKSGEDKVSLTGNEFIYIWNDVSLSMKDYNAKVALLADENLFRLITNPHFFNSQKTSEKRAQLLQIVGNISNYDILGRISGIDNKDQILTLTGILNSKKSLAEYALQLAGEKKKLNDELKLIPARIDEQSRMLPKVEADYELMLREINELTEKINSIDSLITNSSRALKAEQDKQNVIQTNIYALTRKRDKIEIEVKSKLENDHHLHKNKIVNLTDRIETLGREISLREKDIQNTGDNIKKYNEEREDLFRQWHNEHDKVLVFSDDQFICPTCKQKLPEGNEVEKKNELTKNFNSEKVKICDQISAKGKNAVEQINYYKKNQERLKVIISENKRQLTNLQNELEAVKNEALKNQNVKDLLEENEEYKLLSNQIEEEKAKINEIPTVDNSALLEQKREHQITLNSFNVKYAEKDQIAKVKKRIDELLKHERELSQQILDKEKMEGTVQSFNTTKMGVLEERVNKMFRYVQFKLFNHLINGGIEDACICTYKGIPWESLNTAGQVLAGLDVIHTLNNFYKTYAPIFIDRRESVTSIPEMECQIINLIVSPEHKTLTIESADAQEQQATNFKTGEPQRLFS